MERKTKQIKENPAQRHDLETIQFGSEWRGLSDCTYRRFYGVNLKNSEKNFHYLQGILNYNYTIKTLWPKETFWYHHNP